jgi:hypothetical protein
VPSACVKGELRAYSQTLLSTDVLYSIVFRCRYRIRTNSRTELSREARVMRITALTGYGSSIRCLRNLKTVAKVDTILDKNA